MRRVLFAAALLAAATPLAAQDPHAGHHAHPAGLPAGWQARLDRADAKLSDVMFMPMGGGIHATTGPAAIFWRPGQTAGGEYRLEATFTQNKAPRHPEAYGLFLGGRALEGEGQDYLYFVVRGDGKFLIKHRAGSETHTLVNWTEHEAVRRQDEAGKATNTLTVQVEDDEVEFHVNGTKVHEIARVPMLNTEGLYGLRINHNLDVHVEGPTLTAR